jgi:hypothetical protein
MSGTHFKGPMDSKEGYRVDGTEVINSSKQLTVSTFTSGVLTTSAGTTYPLVAPNATVVAKATTGNLLATDFGKNITNTGASGAITLTLPAASTVAKGNKVQLTVAKVSFLQRLWQDIFRWLWSCYKRF